jgi:hypothetical protein
MTCTHHFTAPTIGCSLCSGVRDDTRFYTPPVEVEPRRIVYRSREATVALSGEWFPVHKVWPWKWRAVVHGAAASRDECLACQEPERYDDHTCLWRTAVTDSKLAYKGKPAWYVLDRWDAPFQGRPLI